MMENDINIMYNVDVSRTERHLLSMKQSRVDSNKEHLVYPHALYLSPTDA